MGAFAEVRVHEITDVHRGKVFRWTLEKVTLPNGLTTDLDVIRHPGAAAVVPLLGDSTVILIRQYRHAVGKAIWEIPAGTLSPQEDPMECARRELIEETGYEPRSLQRLGEIVPVPGYSDERIHIFLATDLREASQRLDRDEVLEVHMMAMADALAMIRNGQIVDAKSIVGLLRAESYLREGERAEPGRENRSQQV